MRGFLRFLFALLVGFGIVFYSNPSFLHHPDRLLYYSPCDEPIRYHVGSIDNRFNVSLVELQGDIKEASSIWEEVEGKPLFAYDLQKGLSINMVYDSRQALNQEIGTLENQVKTQENQIKPGIAEFEKRSADFKTRLLAFNQQVEYWNSKGGAPKEEYDKLKAQQQELQKEADELNAMAKSLNQQTSQYNSQISQLNKTIGTFNSVLQMRPEQGLYNPAENRIDIYITNSNAELVHTLAHELGHALGLSHIEDKEGIMYFASSESLVPVREEKQALFTICKSRTTVEIVLKRLALIYKTNFQPSE